MNPDIHHDQSLNLRARALRNHATPAERLLWLHLRKKQLQGFKFRRQHVIAPFILDFYCPSKRLAIEIDGGTHIDREKYDLIREEFLIKRGIAVIRFSNTEVRQNTAFVLERVLEKLNSIP